MISPTAGISMLENKILNPIVGQGSVDFCRDCRFRQQNAAANALPAKNARPLPTAQRINSPIEFGSLPIVTAQHINHASDKRHPFNISNPRMKASCLWHRNPKSNPNKETQDLVQRATGFGH
jgi:hypothetical protein